MNSESEYKNDFLIPQIKEDESPDVEINPETGQPRGGYGKIGDYVRNVSPEVRSENARKGHAAAREKRLNNANAQKAYNLWARAKLPATRAKALAELEELGLPTDQLQAAFQGVGNSAIDNGNPKALETILKAGGQLVDKSAIAITETQMDKSELLAKFGMFGNEEDEE